MIDDFILMDSPWPKKETYHEIIGILDEVSMDPLERELIRGKLEAELQKGKVLAYCGDLVREYIEFYKQNENVLAIEILGFNNIVLDEIGKAFVKVLKDDFICRSTMDYKSHTQGLFKIVVVGSSRKFVTSVAHTLIQGRLEELEKRPTTLILEVIGSEKREDGEYFLLVIYDRHHNKHGYVALKL